MLLASQKRAEKQEETIKKGRRRHPPLTKIAQRRRAAPNRESSRRATARQPAQGTARSGEGSKRANLVDYVRRVISRIGLMLELFLPEPSELVVVAEDAQVLQDDHDMLLPPLLRSCSGAGGAANGSKRQQQQIGFGVPEDQTKQQEKPTRKTDKKGGVWYKYRVHGHIACEVARAGVKRFRGVDSVMGLPVL